MGKTIRVYFDFIGDATEPGLFSNNWDDCIVITSFAQGCVDPDQELTWGFPFRLKKGGDNGSCEVLLFRAIVGVFQPSHDMGPVVVMVCELGLSISSNSLKVSMKGSCWKYCFCKVLGSWVFKT